MSEYKLEIMGEIDLSTYSHIHDYMAIVGENDKVIINAYTQYGYGRDKVYVDYDAIRSCMREIKTKYAGKRIGLPKIGAGLAGGDWGIISGIIDEELEGEDVVVVVY